MTNWQNVIADLFDEMASGLTGEGRARRPRIALAGLGGEHGEKTALDAALMAERRGVEVCYLGAEEAPGIKSVRVSTEDEGHARMEELLDSGEVDGAVTMHYPFPLGVSTVGRVATPARGRSMFVAATTGAASGERVEGMVRNALHGIAVAKACGLERPSVGILNVDGARQAEAALGKLRAGGYDLAFAESCRSDGGAVMRGNDVLQGTPDVLVTDTLTGNMLMKVLSAYATGGSLEAVGDGYGPGVGSDQRRLVCIVSRASGAPVLANALAYAAELVRGGVLAAARKEYERAERAGLARVLAECRPIRGGAASAERAAPPPAEPVSASIAGIDVMDVEDAAQALWAAGIYAESGMGCTGPLVMTSEANRERALDVLRQKGFLG